MPMTFRVACGPKGTGAARDKVRGHRERSQSCGFVRSGSPHDPHHFRAHNRPDARASAEGKSSRCYFAGVNWLLRPPNHIHVTTSPETGTTQAARITRTTLNASPIG